MGNSFDGESNNILMNDHKFLISFKMGLLDSHINNLKKIKEDPFYKNVDIWDGDIMGDHTISMEKLNRYVTFQIKQK